MDVGGFSSHGICNLKPCSNIDLLLPPLSLLESSSLAAALIICIEYLPPPTATRVVLLVMDEDDETLEKAFAGVVRPADTRRKRCINSIVDGIWKSSVIIKPSALASLCG